MFKNPISPLSSPKLCFFLTYRMVTKMTKVIKSLVQTVLIFEYLVFLEQAERIIWLLAKILSLVFLRKNMHVLEVANINRKFGSKICWMFLFYV